jgi:HEAT repeat protein
MTDTLHTLIEQLGHPDHNERSRAVFALDKLDDDRKVNVLVQALADEPELNVREDMVWTLVRLGEAALQPLIALLKDARPVVRQQAAHTLGKLGDTGAVDALIAALQDEDAMVVLKAAQALGQIGDARAASALAPLLAYDRAEVRTMAATVLEGFGRAAVDSLAPFMQHKNGQVREQAAEILGLIKNPQATPVLIEALHDAEWQVRFAAVTALGAINGAKAKRALEPLRDDPDQRVRVLVENVMAQMSDHPAEPSPDAQYHRVSFADAKECAAFISGLARFLDRPDGWWHREEPDGIEVWGHSPEGQRGIDLYLSRDALHATVDAFGLPPKDEAIAGDGLPEKLRFVMGGENVAEWGGRDAQLRLVRLLRQA